MNNDTIKIKFKQRLNKLDSYDSENLECWQIAEAFNKAQVQLIRRTVQGYNQKQEGRESGLVSLDDLQILVKERNLSLSPRKNYALTEAFPSDYLYFKSVRAAATSSTCSEKRPLRVFLAEEANADDLQLDSLKKPSFEWQETYATLVGNQGRIYTNNEFDVVESSLVYYKRPTDIAFKDCVDLATGQTMGADIPCVFKDDIVELIIDEAVSIIAGDIDHYNQMQRNQQNALQNN